MTKHYIVSIDSLITTFSRVESGKEFDFIIKTEDTNIEDEEIVIGDKILATIEDKVYYHFVVNEVANNSLKLKKTFEIEKSIGAIYHKIGVFETLSKEDYDSICTNLFSDFNNVSELSVKEFDAVDLKTMFADWLFKQGKYKRVYKEDKEVLINKLNEFEIAYEKDFGLLIFDNVNFKLETIIDELETNVIDETTEIGDIDRRTVGNGSVKAILGRNNYIKFLKDLLVQQRTKATVAPEYKTLEKQVNFKISNFQDSCENSGLNYNDVLILRFISSLLSKPFVILSGLSGSGKTKIAQSFVEWICENDNQYKIVPVGADWTNREPLLGYPNGLNPDEYITPDSGVLHLLLEASKEQNQKKPYFIILDEMNLSHVERYFADFLSIMESKDTVKLYTGSDRSSTDGLDITQQIGWPKNVFIIGTVNIDETTYMFSPKVLDRANVIEFRITEEEIATFLNNPGIPDLSKLSKQGANMAENFLAIAAISDTGKNEELTNKLNLFFSELKKMGAEFGYRTASEIMQLVAKLKTLEPTIENDVCLDIAIMQKLLPKLHGSRSKLVKVLIALAALCIDEKQKDDFIKNFDNHIKNNFNGIEIKFDISFEKLIRMYKNVLANGFTSYAEA
ncbi:hypothetical protein FVB9288_01112 [Flavobacterium sp. CECT 9288]|uniref:McrB family protein n=1 Tax=Flavobacterium sp. CECT 9288 TaxID=2845819 RepID=UPI001E33FA6B|nr:hypothetical protein [Flavobacterium sp. CECT 9288]CAH0335467.1 hypothetical protein FVB9288_01112 [Flavobacterium sp. CECT 9288]